MSNNENNGSIPTHMIDEPLIIVLDEDDDDDLEEGFVPLITTIVTDTDDEDVPIKNPLKPAKPRKKKVFNRPKNSSNSLTNVNRPILIDTSFAQPSNHQRRGKRNFPPLSTDSVISFITFDKASDVLTVSRMGSVYYCVEDIYLKIFASLCTLDEFINQLSQPLKQVTLSEKISITQQNPQLKKLYHIRYRLISIDLSDYLLKLKQSLITNKNKTRIDATRLIKQQPTASSCLQEKNKRKELSLPPKKRLKSSHAIGIQCDLYLTEPNHNSEKYSLFSIETANPPRKNKLHRSKSLIFNVKQIPNRSSRSCSLPPVKLETEDRVVLKIEPPDPLDEGCSMPMIVDVEENVQVDNSSKIPLDPFPYLRDPSSGYLTPSQSAYNLYFLNLLPKTPETPRDNCPIIAALLEKPIYQRLVTTENPVITNCASTSEQQNAPNTPSVSNQLPPYQEITSLLTHHPSTNKKSSSKIMKTIRVQTPSIDLTQAITEHDNCDMDKIPKLVIRHTKTYKNKTIDTMGQLFPTWFTGPDYRCIHCFNCDRVFTPQLFMTHVDDKQMINEKMLDMTPIQLLTSEKMSEFKVRLWNQFCTNLKTVASKSSQAVKNKSAWKVSN